MKVLKYLLISLVVVIVGFFAAVGFTIHNLEVEKVTDDLHVIYGMGGNAAVLKTEDGTVIIDTMTLRYQGGRIRDMAESLTGSPVSMIINTHYHLDHTHGNPAFEPGTRVVATERTLHHLRTTDAAYFEDARDLMPNETFCDEMELKIGGKTIRLVHPGPGHTDGDLVAIMVEENAIHLGDLFFHHHYPNIDLEAGGSVQQWGQTLENVLALDFERVIPGHGPVTGREELRQFQAFIHQLAEIGRRAKAQGMSLEATRATDRLTEDAGYIPIRMVVPVGLDRDFVLGRAWEETHGAFERRPSGGTCGGSSVVP